MTLKLNPATGLFEDIPDSTTPVNTTLGENKSVAEQPLSTIPETKIPETKPPVIETPSKVESKVPAVESKVESKHKLTEKQQLYVQIVDTQKEFNGESNIPVNHDYWKWLNTYRGLK